MKTKPKPKLSNSKTKRTARRPRAAWVNTTADVVCFARQALTAPPDARYWLALARAAATEAFELASQEWRAR